MAPEHRFLDVERPVGSDDPDSGLRETLEHMGAEGWELAAVLPTDHVNTESGGYVVSSMRLFFRRATDRMQIDEGVYDRSGVQVPFPGKGHGALVVYCPPSWNGTTLTIIGGGNVLKNRVTRRATRQGTTYAAVFPRLKFNLYATSYEKMILNSGPWPSGVKGVPEFEKEDVHVNEGIVTEVDWTGKPTLEFYPWANPLG